MARKKYAYFTMQFRHARRIWSRSNPARKECFQNARLPDPQNLKELAKWECKHCKKHYALSEVECDHLEPIQNSMPQDYNEYTLCFFKLHAPLEKLQILCKPCHQKKTRNDNQEYARIATLKLISEFMGVNFFDLEKSITDPAVLKKLKNFVLKIKQSQDEKREGYLKKFEKLSKAYIQ